MSAIDNLCKALQDDAVKSNPTLKKLVGDVLTHEFDCMERGGDGTHWNGCEEVHWDCKIVQLERKLLEAQVFEPKPIYSVVGVRPDSIFPDLKASVEEGAKILHETDRWKFVLLEQPGDDREVVLLMDDGEEIVGYHVFGDIWKDSSDDTRCYPVAWRDAE